MMRRVAAWVAALALAVSVSAAASEAAISVLAARAVERAMADLADTFR